MQVRVLLAEPSRPQHYRGLSYVNSFEAEGLFAYIMAFSSGAVHCGNLAEDYLNTTNEEYTMNRYALYLVVSLFLSPALLAQDTPANNMEILAEKMKADKKLLVAANMGLTEGEAKGFWEVYEAYQADLAKLNQRSGALIEEYAKEYGSITNDDAKRLLAEFFMIQEEELKMRQSYIPKLSEILPAVKVARYLQIENKIDALIDYELAALIPLAE